ACAPNDEVVTFSGNDESGEGTSSGGRGAQGNDDAAVACRSHCDIIDQCPCWEEGACYETCFEDCSGVSADPDCADVAADYIDCAGAISDACRTGFYGDAFSEDCADEEAALELCVAGL